MPGSSTALRPGGTGTPGRLRPGLLGTLGRTCFRHRWLTLATWLVMVACLITLWTRFGAPAQDNFTGNDPGQALLNQHFHRQSGDTLTLAIRSTAPIDSPAVRGRVTSALVPFSHAAHVTAVRSPYQVPGQISADGHIAFATVQFGVQGSSISNAEALALMHDARAASGPRRRTVGRPRVSACWPPPSCCSSRSARCWPWGCPCSPRCSASARGCP
jgi:hypothetical protein